jgi:uncharacterized membrane protein
MWWNDYLWQWPLPWIIAPLMMIACMAMMFMMMTRHGRRDTSGDDALAILKARFARGDISLAEYEDQRRILGV